MLALALASPANAIDTTPSWNGSDFISSWGVPNTATYGETITPNAFQTRLQNVTFYLGYGGAATQYQAYIYRWNGTRITGSALYTSGILNASAGSVYTPATISTGGVALTPGQQYVVFFSTSTITPQASSAYRWGSVVNSAYSGGQFVYMNNTLDFSLLSTNAWNTIASDLAMIITFDPVSVYTTSLNQGNTVALGAARVIDNNSNLSALFGNLDTQQSVSNAVSQTLPLLTGGSMLATQSALSNFNDIIKDRINSGKRGMSSGDGFLGDRTFWVKPFGSWTTQNDQGSIPGFKADTFGVVAGIDGKVSDAFRIGGALGFAKIYAESQSSVAPQSSDINMYQFIAYGRYNIDATTGINFQANVGENTNQGSRQIAFTSAVATSDYNSQDIHLGLDINKSFAIGEKTKLIPSLRADYTWIKDQSYTEIGAGLLNLHVDSRSADAFVIGPDVKLTHAFTDNISLMGDLGVGYDTINKRASITSAFAGAPGASFVTYGIDPSPWLGRGGLAFVCKGDDGVEVTGRYDAEYRTDFWNQTVSVQLNWAF